MPCSGNFRYAGIDISHFFRRVGKVGLGVLRLSLRQIRISTGFVLFTYVTTHFLNHALANISVAAAESGLLIQKVIWQTLPGAVILYASLTTHMGLGFWPLYERRNFRFTWAEATQLVLGLCIPVLIADHVLGTRVSLSLFGTQKGYAEEFLKFWVRSPTSGVLQAILLLVVWIHGCLGIHFWLRLKPFYPPVKGVLLSLAVLLPALALLGYYQGGEAILLAVDDGLASSAPHAGSRRHSGTERSAGELSRLVFRRTRGGVWSDFGRPRAAPTGRASPGPRNADLP